MQNFDFYNPTMAVFGQDTIDKIDDVETPWQAKLAGGISAGTWTLLIFAGRFLAY